MAGLLNNPYAQLDSQVRPSPSPAAYTPSPRAAGARPFNVSHGQAVIPPGANPRTDLTRRSSPVNDRSSSC